jgi:hypothetical protein
MGHDSDEQAPEMLVPDFRERQDWFQPIVRHSEIAYAEI